MGEDFVTVRIKELARNFGDRIIGIGFVALGIVANVISYPPAITLGSWQRIDSSPIRRLNAQSS